MVQKEKEQVCFHVCLIDFKKHHRLRAPSVLCRASVALTIYWVLSRPVPLMPCPATSTRDLSPQKTLLYPEAAVNSNATGSDNEFVVYNDMNVISISSRNKRKLTLETCVGLLIGQNCHAHIFNYQPSF